VIAAELESFSCYALRISLSREAGLHLGGRVTVQAVYLAAIA